MGRQGQVRRWAKEAAKIRQVSGAALRWWRRVPVPSEGSRAGHVLTGCWGRAGGRGAAGRSDEGGMAGMEPGSPATTAWWMVTGGAEGSWPGCGRGWGVQSAALWGGGRVG